MDLPFEIIEHIFTFLDGIALCQIARVSLQLKVKNLGMHIIQGAYQKFCTLTINFFITHFTYHLSHQL